MMVDREKEFMRFQQVQARTVDKQMAFTLVDWKLTEGSKIHEAEDARYFAKAQGVWGLLKPETRKAICFAMLGIFPRYEFVLKITKEGEECDEKSDGQGDRPIKWKDGSLF
jgi:hypothetical protein